MSSLDLGRQHGFLANVCVQQKGKVWKQRGEPVEPADRLVGLFQKQLQPVEPHGRNRGQRRWHEGANRLTFEDLGNVSPEAGFGRQLGHENLSLLYCVTKGYRAFL